MPTVDFTLEDIKGLFVAERKHTEALIHDSAEEERVHTQGMIEDALLNFWDNNLQPAFDDLHVRLDKHEDEIKGMKRVQRKHSADIVALQALNGI